MLMRITWGKLHPGTWRAFEQAYKDTGVTKGAEVDGLRGRWLVQDDHDPETGYAVSLWDSCEAMWVYEQSAFYIQEGLPALKPFVVGEFTTTYGEMRVIQTWEDELGPYALPYGGEL
jgi:heme-degrading monooxygenase HmoA